jgi:hypothetical protein
LLHPGGQPIIQSVKAGFKVRPSFENFSPESKITRQGWEETGIAGVHPAARRSWRRSVQAIAAFLIPSCLPVWFWSQRKVIPCGVRVMQARLPEVTAVGVGQKENPFPDVSPADFRRRYDACCNPVAQALKVSDDVLETKGEMPCDVLEEAPVGADLGDDPGDLRPEVPVVILPFPESAIGKRLAGITARDDMNAAAPRFAVEGSEIVPYKSRSQGRVRHPGHESGRSIGVSLDITHSPISGFGEVEAEIEASDAGAKAEAAKRVMSLGGTNSHTSVPFRRGPAALGSGSGLASAG